jgi:hypothetical protein
MPRKTHEIDSDTTVVNIADFQRTRDSVCFSSSTPLPTQAKRVVARRTRPPVNKAYSASLALPLHA